MDIYSRSSRFLRYVALLSLLGFALAAAGQQSAPPSEPSSGQAPAENSSSAPNAAAGKDSAIPAAPSGSAQATPAVAPASPAKVEVPSGTRLGLVLHNAISTRSAKIGDPVYLETIFPVMVSGRVAIPAGSYMSGEVTESKRPGRVKGRGELMIKLNTLILPNGYLVNLNATPNSAGTGGGEYVDSEGRVRGDSNKAGDAVTIARTTAAGAGIGAIASHTGEGAGIGAGAGAAVGIAAVLLSRGPEATMPRGSTVDVVLNRSIYLDAEKDKFDGPGQASALAGPPNRENRHRVAPF